LPYLNPIDEIIVSRHAKKRIKQRICKNHQKTAEKAWNEGIHHSLVKGKIRKHIDELRHRNKFTGGGITRFSLFNGYVFLFSSNVLVTVIQLPGRLLESAHLLIKEIKNKDNV